MTTINLGREAICNQGIASTPGVMGNIKSFLVRRQAERQLRQLDDRMLADIGLRRNDITRSVWGR
jgi:uncharacterized protein YjiS (DUF1127 family)